MSDSSLSSARMFDRDSFLRQVLEKAGSQAEMARALKQPSSRVAEFFREKGNKQRTLTMVEGIALAEAFDLWPCKQLSAERLSRVLSVCLQHFPSKEEATDQDVQRLAQEIVLGLELLDKLESSPPSQ